MVKTTIFLIGDQLFGALMHLNSDINLFLIDDPWCKIYNIWLLLYEKNFRSITILELNTGRKYCCSYNSRQGDR